MLVSWRLWFGESRLFPKAPLLGPLADIPPWLDTLFAVAAAISCIAICLLPARRLPYLIALSCGLVLAASDQMRWQPWCYQYWLTLFLLLPLTISATTKVETNLNPLRWIVIAIYLWSGIHKCNSGFVSFYRGDLAGHFIAESSGTLQAIIKSGAHLAGPAEILLAVLLAVPKSRPLGSVLACGMHLAILLFLGPFFGGDNLVILPWNVAMIALVIALFWKQPSSIWRAPRTRAPRWRSAIVCTLVFALPALSMIHRWPQYLSFHLYSGGSQRFQLVLTRKGIEKLDADHRQLLTESPASAQLRVLDLQAWSLAEFGVPVVAEDRVLIDLGRALTERFALEANDGFFYRDFPHYLEQRGWDKFTPDEIRALHRFPPMRQRYAP